MKKVLLLPCLLISCMAFGQLFNPGPFIAGAKEDANYLGGEYLRPIGKALATGINNGWYTTAKTHGLGRFDIMLHPTLMFIPEVDQTFQIDPARLTELELVDPNVATAQTAAGDNTAGPARLRYEQLIGSSEFDAPAGTGFALLPFITAQVNVGLVFDTDLSLRFIPSVGVPGVEGAKIDMFGFGIKHNPLQWLPGDKLLPFDVAVMFNYSQLNFSAPIEGGDDNKEIVMKARGYSARALISKKLLFVTFYGGLGYNSGTTDMNLNGTYSFDNPDPTGPSQVTVTDPVATTAENNGMIGQVGVRLKFLFVMCFSADYTFGAYNAATAGLGFSVDF